MTVDFEIHKWPDRLNWRFTAEELGRDEHGTWLAIKPGSPYTGQRDGNLEYGFVSVLSEGRWWIASFFEPSDPRYEVYVDVTTDPIWTSGSRVTTVDLDLDVVRYKDGRVELIDEDDFEEHRVKYGYPPDVIERALATSQEVLDNVRERREPFAHAGDRWLRKLSG